MSREATIKLADYLNLPPAMVRNMTLPQMKAAVAAMKRHAES